MRLLFWISALSLTLGLARAAEAAASLTVATYNLQNYLLESAGTRPAKALAEREQLTREVLHIRPDLLAVQEIGPPPALQEFQERLRQAGWNLPHTELVGGWDTNIFVAILSRYPLIARRSHSNDTFLLEGRRFHLGRGIVEVDVEPTPGFRITVLATHLKSKRPTARVDEAALREQEARVLRGHVEAILQKDPQARVVVCGDLNDHPDSRPLRLLRSKGRMALTDTRPGEGLPDQLAKPRANQRIVWTHFYAQEDSYARFDYVLLSPSLAKHWQAKRSYVYASPGWGTASDHRPVVVELTLPR
ncbi:MAG: endonuclease/exonuclease/phosphatase family protein [Verrucomicrobia bacterium]|nr:endonuclease/exonuclease/phosphatase family protein [Verrucomicrobiota bacterium]